ncbi:MAG: DUF4139 domain-containing protein [Candidatus Krumholzibacteria bacterium]|nr:DUF4139 domain-containing protein [Candidatus Krumholzibacteria bacterium]
MNVNPMKTQGILLFAGILLLVGALAVSAAEDQFVASAEGDRVQTDVTVYNRDLALVREIRKVTLPAGDFSFEFRDVPSRINPVTLLVSSSGDSELELYEQNYEFDLMSPDKILQKYVGRELVWIQEDGSRLNGTLLGMSNGPVYRVNEEIVFEMPGRLALPELPDNLRARPTLVWLAHTSSGGSSEVETSYLTGGFSWHADYVLQLDEEGEKAGLQAWVTVENRTGASYRDANLLLVAGDLNQVRPAMEKRMVMVADMAGAAPSFQEETLYDYHMYTMQRPTDLLDNQIKQISLFDATGLKVTKHYKLRAQPHFFRGHGRLLDNSKVSVSYSFENTEDNKLGMALPAGVFRVYGRSASGSRQLLGEDRIDHTPKKETVDLTVGKAFDIVAERVRTNSEKLADNLHRTTFEITIRNHRENDVVVEVTEPVGGYWEVIAESLPHRKVSANELAFDVPVSADGETVLTYTVQVKY